MKLTDEYFKEKAEEAFTLAQGKGSPKDALRLLLKEVSRDTRHACGEAVITLGITHFSDEYLEGFNEAKNMAHSACMNVVR